MMKSRNILLAGAAVAVAMMMSAGVANAAGKVLIIGDDGSPPQAELQASGLFSAVNYRMTDAGLTLGDLSGYNAVLAYTNSPAVDPVNFGNVLKSFADQGGRVVVATYGFSNPWAISGGITTSGYAPLVNSGVNGDVSGALTQVASDAVFNGVDLANATYFHNGNYADPNLDPGATLLATDGGVDMIAVNAAHNVYGFNIFPGSGYGTSSDTYLLFANALNGGASVGGVPEPGAWAMMLLGFLGLGGAIRAHRRADQKLDTLRA